VSACSAKTQGWLLTMTNVSTGQTWSQMVSYSSSLASADWIEEAPVSSSVLPLADFNFVGIAPSANSAMPSLSLSVNGIQMSDPWGQTSDPSPADSSGFKTCWGYGSMSTCLAP
jgi:hypothetical protein